MPRRCTACDHGEREAIDQALIDDKEGYRGIAKRFRLSSAAVLRHKADHLPASLLASRQAKEVLDGDKLMTKVISLEADAKRLQQTAEATGDIRAALQAVRELVRIVELQAC